jgi:hypothetical protein
MSTAEHHPNRPCGGRTWWAHLEFIPINIKLTILRKKIEDLRGAAVMSSAGDVQEVSLPQSDVYRAVTLRFSGGPRSGRSAATPLLRCARGT